MEKSTLKMWRLIIPGVTIFVLTIPLSTDNIQQLKDVVSMIKSLSWDDLWYSAVILIVGALYYSLNIRWLVWKHFNNKIQNNIKERIFNLCSLKYTPETWYRLKNSRSLMTVFYHFVDNDESLKDKAGDVRFNGLIWSSCFDFCILSGFGGVAYYIISLVTQKHHLIYFSSILFIGFFVFLGFSSLLTYKHLSLSNAQLDVIAQKYKQDVDTKIREALINL
jgi:hypothetical protein